MKILLDFLPLVFFFLTYKVAGQSPDASAAFATHWFGSLVQGGVVGATEAPALLATVVVVVTTSLAIAYMKLTRQKIHLMMWTSFGMIVVFGGLTVWLHNQMFIMWKPSITFWLLGLVFWGSQAFFHKNLLRSTLGADIELPDSVWQRLNFSYVAFFALMGLLNLWVVYSFRDSWVGFHTFGSTGLTLVFMVGQFVYLSRHMKHEEASDKPAP